MTFIPGVGLGSVGPAGAAASAEGGRLLVMVLTWKPRWVFSYGYLH